MTIDFNEDDEYEKLYYKYSTASTPFLANVASALEGIELDEYQQLHFNIIDNILKSRKIGLISKLLDESNKEPSPRTVKANHLLWRLYSRTGVDQDLVDVYYDKTLEIYDELTKTYDSNSSVLNYLGRIISDMDEEHLSELEEDMFFNYKPIITGFNKR